MSEQQRPDAPREPADAPDLQARETASTPPREIASDQIFAGTHEVLIRHAGELYRLRLTRNGKLILHK
jgi:hemin uptake protein HemP